MEKKPEASVRIKLHIDFVAGNRLREMDSTVRLGPKEVQTEDAAPLLQHRVAEVVRMFCDVLAESGAITPPKRKGETG